jgi:hypothetical protein
MPSTRRRGKHRTADRYLSTARLARRALAYRRGDPHRACVLLAVERDSLFTRSPATWALNKHYRDQTRVALTREELDFCTAEARAAARRNCRSVLAGDTVRAARLRLRLDSPD